MLRTLRHEYLEEENGDMNARVSPASQKGAQAPPIINFRNLITGKLGAILLQLVGTVLLPLLVFAAFQEQVWRQPPVCDENLLFGLHNYLFNSPVFLKLQRYYTVHWCDKASSGSIPA
jgi:hypothetical protein